LVCPPAAAGGAVQSGGWLSAAKREKNKHPAAGGAEVKALLDVAMKKSGIMIV